MVDLSLLLSYLAEDAPHGDVTSDLLVRGRQCTAAIVAKQKGIAAGLEESGALFRYYGAAVHHTVRDGEQIEPGQVLMELSGDATAILLVERTALNIIGRMSGIATKTSLLVQMAREINPRVRVASTRKTSPGFRLLDKKAVMLGGGDPHRISLSDMFLIKDNHLMLVSIDEAVRRARAQTLYKKIEVEVATPEDAVRAVEAGADMIMLDNMPPAQVARTLKELAIRKAREKVQIEVSGGIDETNIKEFARMDIDIISMGALTHSIRNLDVSLEVQKAAKSFTL
jgi:nicotinate-nucleotide pyrophosphorylase (carboxylating)